MGSVMMRFMNRNAVFIKNGAKVRFFFELNK